jgi:hypothetical protein
MNEIIKYFGQSFELPHIEKDSLVPVGGTSIFADDNDTYAVADSAGLESIIDEMKGTRARYNMEGLGAWLSSQNVSISPQLFAPLAAFAQTHSARVGMQCDGSKRMEQYNRGTQKLSDIIYGNMAQCAEISALAQLYLQEEGIKSSMFSGEVIFSPEKNQEFATPHTFILIEHEGKEYIFDPANPLKGKTPSGDTIMPRIYHTDGFREKISRNRKTYVEATGLLDGKTARYGTGDQTNVTEKDFA